jgi:uncharacterized DUF497 family protein
MARLSIDYPLIGETVENLRDTLTAHLLFCLHVTTKVSTLWQEDTTRIIWMRKANQREQKIYQKRLGEN